jgi:hypothetical protein
LGFYGAVIGAFVMRSKSKKEAPAHPAVTAAPSTTTSGDRPSVESEEFGAWIEKEGNVEKLIAEIESYGNAK